MRVFGLEIGRAKAPAGERDEPDFGARVVGSYRRHVPLRGTRELLAAYRESPILQAVARKIAFGVASVGWSTVYVDPNGEEREIPGHPMTRLLRSGPTGMPGLAATMAEELHLLLVGEAFAPLERNAVGAPVKRWPISPHWVRSIPIPGREVFEIVPDMGGEAMTLPMSDVLWIKDVDAMEPYGRGGGVGRSLADEITADEAAALHVSASLQNRALPEAIVSGTKEAPWTSEDRDRAEAVFTQRFGGPSKAGRAMFASGPVNVTTLTPTFKDLELNNLRAFERDIVIQAFGMPPELIGLLANSNRATIQSAEYLFAKWVVRPRLLLRQAAINDQLAPQYDERIEARFEDPVDEDWEFKQRVMVGRPDAFTMDEHRELAGMAPLPDGAGEVFPQSFATIYGRYAAEVVGGSEEAPEGSEVTPADAITPAGGADVQQTALNGAQIQALQQIVQAVADGSLPAETAVQLIQVGFPTIDEATARDIIEPAIGFAPASDGEMRAAVVSWVKAAGVVVKSPADDAIAAIDDTLFRDVLRASLTGTVRDFAQEALDVLGVGIDFDLQDPRVLQFIAESAADRSKLIGDTTRALLRSTLSEGIAGGESTDLLVARIRETVTDAGSARAHTIARTEIVRASNAATTEAHRQAGIDKREWLATQDDRVRDAHMALDGRTVGIDEPFNVEGSSGMYPGGFGVPSLDINCRCAVIPVIDGLDGEKRKAAWKAYDGRRLKHERALERRSNEVFAVQAEAAVRALRRG